MPRLVAGLFFTALPLLLLACSQEEEAVPSATPFVSESPADSGTPPASATPIPELTATPAASEAAVGCPEVYPAMHMTLLGPSNAVPGSDLTYALTYDGSPGPMHINFSLLRFATNDIPQPLSPDITYVSSRRLSGMGDSEITTIVEAGKLTGLAWKVGQGDGDLEFTLRVASGSETKSLQIGAYISGVCAPRAKPIVTAVGPG